MSEWLKLKARDGHEFGAYLAQPRGKPQAGLLVIQEIFGVNAHMRTVADGFAAEGYLAISPAVFDRMERGVELGYDSESVSRGRDLRARLDWEKTADDLRAAADAVASAGKVGSVGYCWGGTLVWLTATRGIAAAGVGYYGGQIGQYIDEKPACPLQLHFGKTDASIPLEGVAEIGRRHPEVEIHLYDAGHGFNCDHRGSYHKESAELALTRTLGFLKRYLE
ncbi:MAG: dienelactone hydrolase family protein [Kiloniellales bacterium]